MAQSESRTAKTALDAAFVAEAATGKVDNSVASEAVEKKAAGRSKKKMTARKANNVKATAK